MNSQTLEAQSEAERGEIEDTISELKRRLTPGQLVDEVLAHTKDGGGQFFSNLGNQATENPLPVTLIGAGLAWFLFSKNRAGGNATSQRSHLKETSGDRGSSTRAAIQSGLEQASSMARHGMDTVSDGLGRASESLSAASHSASASLSSGSAAANDLAAGASAEARELAARSVDLLKDHPVILLGAGVAIGALLGASVPLSDAEVGIMGETSREMQRDAMNTASDQADKLAEAGTHLYKEVSRAVEDEVQHFVAGENRDDQAQKSDTA